MAAIPGSILPDAYFDGLSALWGGCAFLASGIVASGLVVHAVRGRHDAGSLVWLLAKVLLIAICTVFIREWLMRLNDIVTAFGSMMGIDPRKTDARFVQFIAGKTAAEPNASMWDIIWGTKSIGTAVCYAFLWLFGWLSWGLQYVVKLVGGILLTAGWALSPIFLSFFILRPMTGIAQRYVLSLVALVCWPFGWVIAAVVTNAMLDAASAAKLIPVFALGSPIAAPALTVLLIGAWMMVSSVLAPWVITKILFSGANPAAAFAQSVGGVAQAAFSGGVGAAVAAATGGAGAVGILAASAGGALAGGGESAVRGGSSAQTTSAALRGLSGLYSGSLSRRQTAASEASADAQTRQADASERFASQFDQHSRQRRESQSGLGHQPHSENPNQAALEIDSHENS